MSDIITGASTDSGRTFWEGGRWAGEQMLQGLREGKELNTNLLRTADTLRKDEWKVFDEAVIAEGIIRLRGVADIMAAGLVRRVPNGIGKTIYEWEKVTDMHDALVSMDGNVKSENDRMEFDLDALPLPITHKDFFINIRTLQASRSGRGESLDTMQARVASRLVAEKTESMLFNGLTGKYRGLSIYGYTNHPNRNTGSLNTANWENAAKTGDSFLTDVLAMKAVLEGDRMYGPYVIYCSGAANLNLDKDFKANSDWTIRQRLLMVDGVTAIRISDQLSNGNVVMVQMTDDVVVMVEGERLQTIQWDINGGFTVNFKVFQILVPLIRADAAGRSGVAHFT